MSVAGNDAPTQVETPNLARIGQILTASSGGMVLVILGFWLFAQATGAVALTIAQLPVVLVVIVSGIALSGIVALAATAINGWQLRVPRRDRVLGTSVASATLVVALLFLFVTLLPHLRVAQFAQGFQQACGAPLTSIANDISAAADAAKQTAGDDGAFIAAMTKYAGVFQQDGAAIPQHIARLQALGLLAPHYQHAIADCVTEFQAIATLLVGTNGVSLPPIFPAPFGGVSLSAQSLFTLAGAAVSGTLNGIPKISSLLMSGLITLAFGAVATTCDATCQHLKVDGDQLETDVFAPFKVKTT